MPQQRDSARAAWRLERSCLLNVTEGGGGPPVAPAPWTAGEVRFWYVKFKGAPRVAKIDGE